jgi:hypothetical protein
VPVMTGAILGSGGRKRRKPAGLVRPRALFQCSLFVWRKSHSDRKERYVRFVTNLVTFGLSLPIWLVIASNRKQGRMPSRSMHRQRMPTVTSPEACNKGSESLRAVCFVQAPCSKNSFYPRQGRRGESRTRGGCLHSTVSQL